MNPILLKPTTDMGSQVIVNGVVQGNMKAMEYYCRKPEFFPAVLDAYNSLAAEYDVIIIEGAGSPAEINLKKDDIVNKFRGDRAVLEPGLEILEKLCGVPVMGVMPYLHVDIDGEDSLSARFDRGTQARFIDIAVIRLPRISNFADFSPFDWCTAFWIRICERWTFPWFLCYISITTAKNWLKAARHNSIIRPVLRRWRGNGAEQRPFRNSGRPWGAGGRTTNEETELWKKRNQQEPPAGTGCGG